MSRLFVDSETLEQVLLEDSEDAVKYETELIEGTTNLRYREESIPQVEQPAAESPTEEAPVE